MAVVVNRPSFKGDLLPPHLHQGREPYALAVMVQQNPDRVVWADTFAEVVSVLTRAGEAYVKEADEAARLETRASWLVACQIQSQAFINALASTHTNDWSTTLPWEREVLNGRRTLTDQPGNFPTRQLFGCDLWSAEVPLVCLVSTGHPENPILTNNDSLLIIDALNDETAVRSLASMGYLRLWVSTLQDGEGA